MANDNTALRCDGGYFISTYNWLKIIEQKLDAAYWSAKGIYNAIESGGAWDGDTHKAMLAYMDLMLQYHAKLATNRAGSGSPIGSAVNAFKQLIDNLDGFYDNSSSYQDLKRI